MSEIKVKVIFDNTQASTASKKLKKDVQAVAGSYEDLTKKLQRAKNILDKTLPASWKHNKALSARGKLLKQLSNTYDMNTKKMTRSTEKTASMTMAMQSMNFTIRDSPYFFRDFSLGILAVGNNLNPMIDSLIRVKQANEGWRGAMRAFGKELTGSGGVIFGFSILVTVIQAVTFAVADNKRNTEDLGESYEDIIKLGRTFRERLKAITDEIKSIKTEDFPAYIRGLNVEVEKLEKKTALNFGAGIIHEMILGVNPSESKAVLNDLIETVQKIVKLTESQRETSLIGARMQYLLNAQKEAKLTKSILESYFNENSIDEIKKRAKELTKTLRSGERKVFDIGGFKFGANRKDLKSLVSSLDQAFKDNKKVIAEAVTPDFEDLEAFGAWGDKLATAWVSASPYDQLIEAIERDHGKVIRKLFSNEMIQNSYEFGRKTGEHPLYKLGLDGLFEGVKQPKKKGTLTDQDRRQIQEMRKELQTINRLSDMVGNNIWSAFNHGNKSALELLNTLGLIALKMAVVSGFKYLFAPSQGLTGILSFLSPENTAFLNAPSIGNQTIMIPEFKMNAREFIINFNQAQNQVKSTIGFNEL